MPRYLPPLAAILFSSIDVAVTLLGQPPGYWHGDNTLAREGNPFARPFLVWHPLAFLGLAVIWWLTLGIGLTLAPPRWAGRLAAVFVVSHGFGAAGWLWIGSTAGPLFAIAWLAVAVETARHLWRKAKTPADRPGFSGAGGI